MAFATTIDPAGSSFQFPDKEGRGLFLCPKGINILLSRQSRRFSVSSRRIRCCSTANGLPILVLPTSSVFNCSRQRLTTVSFRFGTLNPCSLVRYTILGLKLASNFLRLGRVFSFYNGVHQNQTITIIFIMLFIN
jgi:hypothetical protein